MNRVLSNPLSSPGKELRNERSADRAMQNDQLLRDALFTGGVLLQDRWQHPEQQVPETGPG